METTIVRKELLSYNGPFSIKVISVIAKFIAETYKSENIPMMRFYRVLIELAQNVALYSADRITQDDGMSIGIGTLNVFESEKSIICRTHNEIFFSHQEILDNNCKRINSSSEFELKKRKELLRRESSLCDTGAHIGLITIALYSGNHLDVDFSYSESTNKYYFTVCASVSKINMNEALNKA